MIIIVLGVVALLIIKSMVGTEPLFSSKGGIETAEKTFIKENQAPIRADAWSSIAECLYPLVQEQAGNRELFPPSPIKPTLPPKNPHPYEPDRYICRQFTTDFCKNAKPLPEILLCRILRFDKHAINIIRTLGSDGKQYVCVVEPQSNEYYCMLEKEFNNLDLEKWVKKVLCEQYYKLPPDICAEEVALFDRCADLERRVCDEEDQWKKTDCVEDNGNDLSDLTCRCTGFLFERECRWQR